jgi:chromosome segregation ATPase
LTIAIRDLTENNVLLQNNNEVLYKKYKKNILGCNKNLNTCITQFEEEENILKQNIKNEYKKKITLLETLYEIQNKIETVKNKIDLLNKKGGTKSYNQIDQLEGLNDSISQLKLANTNLKKDVEILKANIETLEVEKSKLEVEKSELEENQKTIKDANTEYAFFIQLVNNIQLLEKEYYIIQSVNKKLQIIIQDLNDKYRDLNKEYANHYKYANTNNNNTTVKKQHR